MSVSLASGLVAGEKGAPGLTIVLPGQTPAGEYILSVLLKRTYDIVPGGEL